jgi:ornithine cyclodeaminase/alanine dehydrogenase-like protein (mu-crystallin family)
MAILINRRDIEPFLRLEEAVPAVEAAFKAAGQEPMLNHPRRRLHWRPSDARKLNIFAGSLPELGYIGALVRFDHANRKDSRKGSKILHPPAAYDKEAGSEGSYGKRFVYALFNEEGLASIQYGGTIGRGTPIKERTWHGDPVILRTAATSAVGTKYLARKNSEVLGFFGTGFYAPSHLAAMVLACPKLKKARVFSPNKDHKRIFCREIQQVVDAEIVPASEPREAVKDADVVMCCTNSIDPVFDGHWVKEGTHATGIIGQNNYLRKGEWWGASEVDDHFLQRCDTIFVNSLEQAQEDQQASTWDAVRRGIIEWSKVRELGGLVAGKCSGRADDRQITFYQNNAGQGIADLALAIKVHEIALKKGLGKEIEL